jgi:hypothetical protein
MVLNDQERDKLKLEYAANLLRFPDDPFKAAFCTTPDNGLALQIGRDWPRDAFVQAQMDKLMSSTDASNFLPTKESQARDIYAIASDVKTPIEDRLKAHRLYAEVRGFIEKPSQSGGGINILTQGVMIVKDQGSDQDWAQKAKEQQRTLIGHATVN